MKTLAKAQCHTTILNAILHFGMIDACNQDACMFCQGWKFFSLKRLTMLWTVLVILLLMWALGIGFSVGGSLIHLLLVVALVVLVLNLLQGRRAV